MYFIRVLPGAERKAEGYQIDGIKKICDDNLRHLAAGTRSKLVLIGTAESPKEAQQFVTDCMSDLRVSPLRDSTLGR